VSVEPAVFTIDPAARAALQRRTLRVLTMGQVVGAAALASAITVGGFVVEDIMGAQTPWVGISTAAVTAGSGAMSQVLSRLMRGRGRRPGMEAGYGMAVIGGLIAAAGVQLQLLPIFLVGLFLYGGGSATNLLARYAATDLAEVEDRGKSMSRILFASTFGAVLGPALIGPAEQLGQAWFGLAKYTGPWLFSSMFFLLAMVNTTIRLRPDPLVIAGGTRQAGDGMIDVRLLDSLRVIARAPMARLAVCAMVVSQAVMVAVMAMAPIDLKMHGHEQVSQFVVSIHIAGMFAFSPIVGRYVDWRGRLPAILAGSVVLIIASVLSALAADNVVLMFVAMWTLGFGWTLGLVGGSSLLIDNVPASHRVAVQGAADLSMSLCGGAAGFASGFIRKAVGFPMLANLATLATVALLVASYLADRYAGHPR
jgi:MFS family permease